MGTASSRLPFDPLRDIHWKRSVQIWKRFFKRLKEALFSKSDAMVEALLLGINATVEALLLKIDAMKEPPRRLLKKIHLGKLLLPESFKPEQYDSIPPGTALRVKRVFKCIQHVGLAVGGGLVIHLRKADEHKDCRKCIEAKKANPRWSVNTDGHGGKGVVVTCMSCFARGDKMVAIPFGSKHGVSAFFRTTSHRGGKSFPRSSDPPEKVLDRAYDKLVNGLSGDYNLMHNNCDMFVYYCKTGVWLKKSSQAMEGWGFLRIGGSFGGLSRWWPTLVWACIYILLVYLGFAPGFFFKLVAVIFVLTYEFLHKYFCRYYSCFKEMRTSSKEPVLKKGDPFLRKICKGIWLNKCMFI